MDKTYGVGIVGCGNISTTYFELAPLFRRLEVRACADLNMDSAHERGSAYNVRAETVDELMSDDAIDIIVNLTIPDAHYAVTRQALEAGKHAYSEKPVALSIDDGKALAVLADEHGLKVGSAPDTFLGGAHQLARSQIDSGVVGRIVAGTAHVMSHGMEHWHPNPDFFFQPGAGPMLDVGPYYIANLINLLGPATRVAALTSSASPTRTISSQPRAGEAIPVGTPTNIHALVEFANGATVTVSTSWDVWAHEHAPMELYGTEGSLFVPDPNFFGGEVRASGRGTDIHAVEAWDHPCGRINVRDRNNGNERANYRTVGLADMAAAIDEGRDHRCSLERALHGLDIMISILKSGETGQFVDLTTTCDRPAPFGPEDAAALMK